MAGIFSLPAKISPSSTSFDHCELTRRTECVPCLGSHGGRAIRVYRGNFSKAFLTQTGSELAEFS